jgi:hypothetical protein
MNFAERNQAVVDLVIGGQLQAAIQLAAVNEQILLDEHAEFDRRTTELIQLLTDVRANRNHLPMLAVGSHDYHEAFRVLETYRPDLEQRGFFDEVMSIVLGRLKPIQWQSGRGR